VQYGHLLCHFQSNGCIFKSELPQSSWLINSDPLESVVPRWINKELWGDFKLQQFDWKLESNLMLSYWCSGNGCARLDGGLARETHWNSGRGVCLDKRKHTCRKKKRAYKCIPKQESWNEVDTVMELQYCNNVSWWPYQSQDVLQKCAEVVCQLHKLVRMCMSTTWWDGECFFPLNVLDLRWKWLTLYNRDVR